MRYEPARVKPFREELTALGIRELATPEAVDEAVGAKKGTTLVVVNSVCGCAAGAARPAVRMALEKGPKPDAAVSVFAGMEEDATSRLRQRWLTGQPPSSPAIALFRDGQLMHFIPRSSIEKRPAGEIAVELSAALEKFCTVASS
ncbi:MAG: BrxA/BrxB family bacilliredoxin [Ignavibacteriales bacterium]|nr:BrxA/BrxB family bacilliredoxin [Ignavibacteriales bacterium]